MRFVLRKSTASGSSNPMKPRPRTGPVPFEARCAIVGRATTTRMNGIGSFVPSINKLTFEYNNTSQKSQLFMLYIQTVLPSFAIAHRHIEIVVVATARSEATISALYGSGKVKSVNLSALNMNGIVRSVEELANQKGGESKRLFSPVNSYTTDPLANYDPFCSKSLFRP